MRNATSIIFLLMALSTVPVCWAESKVWVFTTEQLPPLSNINLAHDVFVLDDIDASLAGLRFPNPGSEEQARAHANALLNSPTGQALLADIQRNSESVALAWRTGIGKLPAVLVDEAYVVYGVSDVQTALDHIERYRREK